MAVKNKLVSLQTWFGQAISHPLPKAYPGNPLAVSLPNLEVEADDHLNSKGGLSGFQRLGIYNQQYWFRLITIMQSEYPCSVHLMGLHSFNQWAIRFLQAHPPSSPYLAQLDLAFPNFMREFYAEPDKASVHEAIDFDRAYSKAFDAPDGLTLKKSGLVDSTLIMSKKLCLAPHLTALQVSYDFVAYRKLCRSDESLEAVFPLELSPQSLVICRNENLEIEVIPIPSTAQKVLAQFQSPALLPEVFERLDGKLSELEQQELVQGLTGWFQGWVAAGWLGLEESPT